MQITDPTNVSVDELIQHRIFGQQLSLRTGQHVQTDQSGSRLSGFRGRGIDFDEFRAYQAGDDVRDIDWRVTARSGKTHIKVFKEERERPVLIVTDLGSQHFFASRQAFKSVLNCHISSLIAWAATANGDRVGGLIASDVFPCVEVKPRGNNEGALRLCKQLNTAHEKASAIRQQQTTSGSSRYLSETLATTIRLAKPGSLVCIISDFSMWNNEIENQLKRLRQHCDCLAIQLTDPIEQHLPAGGVYPVTDMYGSSTAVIDTRHKSRQQNYQASFKQRQSALQSSCKQLAIQYMNLTTATGVEEQLKNALGLRRGVR